jgi:hypothetical protein
MPPAPGSLSCVVNGAITDPLPSLLRRLAASVCRSWMSYTLYRWENNIRAAASPGDHRCRWLGPDAEISSCLVSNASKLPAVIIAMLVLTQRPG